MVARERASFAGAAGEHCPPLRNAGAEKVAQKKLH